VLTRDEIAALLSGSPERYRPIIGVAVLAGLRQQEVLGLRWHEIDFKNGVLKVRHQLTRGTRKKPSKPVRLKTKAGIRDVVLLPDLAVLLQEHLGTVEASRELPRQDDFVFTTATGAPMNYRNVSTRGLDNAAKNARLNGLGLPRLTFHDLVETVHRTLRTVLDAQVHVRIARAIDLSVAKERIRKLADVAGCRLGRHGRCGAAEERDRADSNRSCALCRERHEVTVVPSTSKNNGSCARSHRSPRSGASSARCRWVWSRRLPSVLSGHERNARVEEHHVWPCRTGGGLLLDVREADPGSSVLT
jgi:Phage integrase family